MWMLRDELPSLSGVCSIQYGNKKRWTYVNTRGAIHERSQIVARTIRRTTDRSTL